MSLTDAFREVAIKRSTKQPQMVDQLLEEAPILGSIRMEDSTDGLHNTYEEIESVTPAQLVDADEALPVVNAKTNLKQVDLSVIGGLIECGEDKARAYGGAAAYFAKKQPMIMQNTGMDLEKSILYNSFRAYALENSKLQSAAGSGTTNYSMLCVKFVPGQITGLFDSEGFGNGAFMDVAPIAGGDLYLNSNGVLVKGIRYKSYMGIQLANARYVSGIANIDIVNDKTPSQEQIEQMLEDARATAGNTLIMCHPMVLRRVLGAFKTSALQMRPDSRDYNTMIDTWDGIEIVTSRNFDAGDEATVSI